MLQFVTGKSERYSIAEEAQMAIEGGCRWIQVSGSLPEGTTQKEVLGQIKPLCEENEAFLMVDSDVELANEMRIHGVHLRKGDMEPAKARELLGPHAVIGVDAASAEDILALKGLDMDYAVLDFGELKSVAAVKAIVDAVRAGGFDIHIVAKGDIADTEIVELRNAGVAGFALSRQIIEAADPVAATEAVINLLGQ